MTTSTRRDGQQIAYEDHGGDGPPVVLLHSFLMDGRMFEPQVAGLGDEFRLITVDERGHGGTAADEPFDYWDVARDVLAVMEDLSIDRAAVAGTSQGGFVALRTAMLAPDRVTAVVATGTSAAAEPQDVAAQYRQLAAAWAGDGPPDEVLDTVAGICLGEQPPGPWRDRWAAVEAGRMDLIMDTLVTRDGIVDRLGEVRCPTLVMHGSADAAYPVARAQEIADGVPGAEPLVVVDGGAHFLSYTDPEAVTPRMGDFLTANAT